MTRTSRRQLDQLCARPVRLPAGTVHCGHTRSRHLTDKGAVVGRPDERVPEGCHECSCSGFVTPRRDRPAPAARPPYRRRLESAAA